MNARAAKRKWRISLIEIAIIGVSAAFTALPLLACGILVWNIYWGIASTTWKPVEARVIVEVPVERASDQQFTYEYAAAGTRYQGRRIGYRGSEADTDRLRSLQVGDSLAAYYDPGSPSRAVLSPGTDVWTFFWLAFAALFALVTSSLGVGIVVAAYGSSRALDAAVMFMMRSMLTLFTFIPLAFVVVISGEIWRGLASDGWPAVQGTVLANDLLEKPRQQQPGSRSPDETPIVSNRIVYGYEVAGRRYRSERIGFTSSFPTRAATLDRHERLPVGIPVTVFYNPADPADAVLEKGTGGYLFVYLVFSVLATLVFGYPLYRALRRRPGSRLTV